MPVYLRLGGHLRCSLGFQGPPKLPEASLLFSTLLYMSVYSATLHLFPFAEKPKLTSQKTEEAFPYIVGKNQQRISSFS